MWACLCVYTFERMVGIVTAGGFLEAGVTGSSDLLHVGARKSTRIFYRVVSTLKQ